MTIFNSVYLGFFQSKRVKRRNELYPFYFFHVSIIVLINKSMNNKKKTIS